MSEVRIGKCYRCGMCCAKGIMLFEGENGVPIRFVQFSHPRRLCGSYDAAVHGCSHYDSRPTVCSSYPLSRACVPSELYVLCGFAFIDEDSYFGKIAKGC